MACFIAMGEGGLTSCSILPDLYVMHVVVYRAELKKKQNRIKQEIFGRETGAGIAIFYIADGEHVTRLDENIYPVGDYLSARYEHPEGLIISREDADMIGIDIEE